MNSWGFRLVIIINFGATVCDCIVVSVGYVVVRPIQLHLVHLEPFSALI
jgi:hypothetical protein